METSTRPRSIPGKFVLLQASGRTPASRFLLREAPALTPASIPTSRSIKGITRSYDLAHKWKTHTYDAWKIFDNRMNGLAQAIGAYYIKCKVLPEELTRSLSGSILHIMQRYCLRSLHAHSQAGSILHIMQRYCLRSLHAHSQAGSILHIMQEFVYGAIMGMRHKAGMGLRKPEYAVETT
ncbi:hypothetical protein DY000_02008190 [Brassica cretica]|uniref:Uncharacterized protein n=1 Tax=Brassica cretica TaxID=69181 RepID=A0ABQ7CGK3_BRACR|nr:hypothetical protein DY000_02008190 [Brassica cretica]